METIRMAIAHVWDWLFPRSCWAESAAWAMRCEGCRLRRRSAPENRCEEGATKEPGCWCGKFHPYAGKGRKTWDS